MPVTEAPGRVRTLLPREIAGAPEPIEEEGR
jgi:hypothetical protein